MTDAPKRRSSSTSLAIAEVLPPPSSLEDVGHALRALQKRFDAHVEESRAEVRAQALHREAVLSILGDLVARL